MLNNDRFELLKRSIEGEVYTDECRRYELSTDGSIFRVMPTAVVYPKTDNDVVNIVNFARENGLTIHSRGAGSGLAGSALGRGIIIDFTKFMNKLISIDIDKREFVCEPGYRHGELEKLISKHNLFFPPAPSSGEYATFGGMYGTNAGGEYSVKYGNVADYIIDADIVLSNGYKASLRSISETSVKLLPTNLQSLYALVKKNETKIKKAYPKIRCNVCGYELRDVAKGSNLSLGKLLGGSEGTLAIVTKLHFSLMEKKKFSTLLVAYFADKISSAKASQIVLEYDPSAIEIMDKSLLSLASSYRPELKGKIPDNVDNMLMIEFDGDNIKDVDSFAKESLKRIKKAKLAIDIAIATSKEEIEQLSAVRKAAVPILYQLKGDKKIIALVEDASVPTKNLTKYFKGLYKIFGKHKVDFVSYGHIAKGLLHNRPLINLKDSKDIKLLKILADEIYELVEDLGGTISGEHGDGRVRSIYIPKQYKSIYKIFLEVKKLLDSDNLLNPDIKTNFDSNQLSKDLRYEIGYKAKDINSKELIWQDDEFILEAEKCHGCSKCTTVTDSTRMCPIYKALRDEPATPKSKANILRGLISGSFNDAKLYDKQLQEVMSRCVNCGSCSIECPSKVNIPKLALEAKSKYIERFGATIDAKITTNFETAGKIVKYFTKVVESTTKPILVRRIIQAVTGLSAKREFIKFSSKSLHDVVKNKEGEGTQKVLYFAGCYASYINPNIARSTVNILAKLGYTVVTPKQSCCGIPHLSKGMSSGAKKQIKKNLTAWGNLIEEVDYIVTACSSCALSLYKEWSYYSNDDMVKKIKDKVKLITEFDIPKTLLKTDSEPISVAYHSPCHIRLLNNPQVSVKRMQSIPNINCKDISSSCCGMAGSFGLLEKNYDVSVKVANSMVQGLNNSDAKYATTDCPTCAMQIEHLTNKLVLNPAEVIDKCLKD